MADEQWWESDLRAAGGFSSPKVPPVTSSLPEEEKEEENWWERDLQSSTKATDVGRAYSGLGSYERPVEAPQESIFRSFADPFLNIGAGINDVVKGFTDAFGADNAVSQNLAKNSEWYRSLLSAGAKEDAEEIGRIMQEAEGQGVLAEIGAGLKALTVAPVDLVSQGIGSLIPFIATAGVGKAVGLSKAGIAVLQGVQGGVVGGGIVKGEIYDAVKDQLVNSGVDEEKAEKAAMEAQSYNGKNLDQIFLGVGLGVAASTTGADSAIRSLISRKVGKEAAEQVSEQAIQEVLRTGFVRGAAKSAAVEFATEGLQGGQEKLAANVAVGREGFDVDPMRGVVAQGTLEGSIGALLAGGVGGVNAKVEQMDAREKVALRDAAKAAEEAKQSNAPASAAAVEEQINQTLEETPEQRVARLQEEATAAAGIELEEEGVGVEPTVPVTPPVEPTPEGAVAPVEPVVTPEAAEPQPIAELTPTEPVAPTPEEQLPVAERPVVAPETLNPRGKQAVKILTSIGVDEDTASYVASRYQDEAGDLGAEEWRDFVRAKFEENGGVIPAQMRYSEDPEYYQIAFDVSPEEAATLADNGRYQNEQMAQAELQQNKQWRRKDEQITEAQRGITQAQPEAQGAVIPAGEIAPSPAIEGRGIPLPAAAPTEVTPNLEPLRRVARAEQTEEDVSGLVGQGLVELYNGQPVITQAGLETLPEAERPRLTPEARKIQIDTGSNEVVAEAIAKNLRIGVDQVGANVRMPAGWTLVEDIYVPPAPQIALPPVQRGVETSGLTADGISTQDAFSTAVKLVGREELDRMANEFIQERNLEDIPEYRAMAIEASARQVVASERYKREVLASVAPEVAKPTRKPRKVKDTATMTAGEINKELDGLRAESSQITDEFIAAGRGEERPSEYLKKTDPLSVRAKENSDRMQALRNEIRMRYGADISQLPAGKGFGPRARPEPETPPPTTKESVKVAQEILNEQKKKPSEQVGIAAPTPPPMTTTPQAQILPSEQSDKADAVLAISKKNNFYTLWFVRQFIDGKPVPPRAKSFQYLTILSTDPDEAVRKASVYASDIAGGQSLSVAFSGKNLQNLEGAKTVAILPEFVEWDKLSTPLRGAAAGPIGQQTVGFGKYRDIKVDDLYAKDSNYVDWLMSTNPSNKRVRDIVNYLRTSSPELQLMADVRELEGARIRAYEDRESRRKGGEQVPVSTLVRREGQIVEEAVEQVAPKPKATKLTERKAKDQMVDIVSPRANLPDRIATNLKPQMYPIQVDGANAVIDSMDRFSVALNGDGAGVGKTRQIIAVADHYAKQGKPVVIVTENAAIGKPWEGRKTPILGGSMAKDSEAMGVTLNLLTETDKPADSGSISITTYNRVTSQNIPTGAIVIFDESQNLANTFGAMPDERAGTELGQWQIKFRDIFGRAERTAFYSATPADKPHQLAYLYKVLGFNSPEEYLSNAVENGTVIKTRRFGSIEQKYYDVPSGRNRKANLYKWVNGIMTEAGNVGRFIKREISYEGTDVQFHDVKGTDLEKNPWAKPFLDALAQMSSFQAQGYLLLAPNSYVLYGAELTKIGDAVKIAKRELDAGRKIVIYFSRINDLKIRGRMSTMGMDGRMELSDPVDLGIIPSPVVLLRDELKKEGIKFTELHGKSGTTSQKAQKEFAGPTNVLLASVESGGTGINLDDTTGKEPRTEIFMFSPYRGISTIQAMGRIWRASTIQNDNKPNRFIFATASDIDADASRSAVLAKKLQLMNASLGGTAVSRLPMSKTSYDPSQLVGVELPEEGVESAAMAERTGVLMPVDIKWSPTRKGGFYSKATADLLEWMERGGPDRTGINVSVFKSRDSGEWVALADKEYKPEDFVEKPETPPPTPPTIRESRRPKLQMPRPAGMETEAVATKLESLGFGRGGIVSVVNEPNATFEGRTIIRDGKVVAIELNAAALKDDAAIERVLNHEIAESANADGALNNLVAGLTPKERKEINDAITRLGYAERARTAEEAARAVELLAEGWRGRRWFERAVARVEAWANKLGYKLTRRAAEYIAARNVSEINAEFKQAYNKFINVQGEAREARVGEQAVIDADMGRRSQTELTPQEIEQLERGEKIRVYRAMQVIDGKLYPPMSALVGDRLRKPTEIGTWEKAEERPDLLDKKGKFVLQKGNKATVPAAYNPYFHTSSSPLNDQFSSAYKRDNLVTVEVEVPASELTSGYKAEGAKDAVGEVRWNAGPVSSKLPADKKRRVVLSRYAKVVRIVPDSEVAGIISNLLEGTNLSIPENTVTPSLKAELEKKGITITPRPVKGEEIRESRREDAIPTFSEGSPEAATLTNMKASMAKVDGASEGKPNPENKPTYKISEIASVWMDQGGDARQLQDMVVEYTNLTPANAKKVANAIAKQYDIQQSIKTAFLETPAGVSVEALPEGVTLPKEVDPDRPRPVMQRLFDVFMGVRVKPVKITGDEKAFLKSQIRLKAAANRAAKQEQQRTADEVVEIIKSMELRGPVRPKQAQALAKRAAKVIWTSEKSMENFVEYAAKVVENANYDADLREAKAAQKRAKELSKQKRVAMSPQRLILQQIGNVAVNKLDDPRMFAEMINYYLRGFKDVRSPDYVVVPDEEITGYISQLETESVKDQAEVERETNERLARKYDLDPNTIPELMSLINIIEEIEGRENREALESILTDKAIETQDGLRGYDTTALTNTQKKLVESMLGVDLKSINNQEKQMFIRIANNMIYNNQTNGAEYFVATAKGQQNARKAAQDSKMIQRNKAWIPLIPSFGSLKLQETLRNFSLELQSVADTFRNVFGKDFMAKAYEMMGMLDLNEGFTKANNTIDEIQDLMAEFHQGNEKTYGDAARNQDGILSEGVAGFLIQEFPFKDEATSIQQRRNLINEYIANARESRQKDRVAMADRVEAILNKVDGASVQEILNNMKREYRPNYDSLMWYKDVLFPKYKDFLKQFDENFNDQANNYDSPNYLPIAFTSAGPALALGPEDVSIANSISLQPKQSVYTIKRQDYTTLPKDKDGNPKEIEFNLRRTAFNSLSDQINKAYTNPAWQQIFAFMKTPESIEFFGDKANRDFFVDRLNRLRASRARRGSVSGGALEKALDSFSIISRKLGTGIALGGVFQWIKQPPDQLLTALGSGGRADLLAKNIAPSTQKAARELLNQFSIGRRGDSSAGYKYINQMEGHQSRMERYFSESKWEQAKEQGGKIADVWMVALKKSDFISASAAWMTYYEGELNKNDIKIDDWAKEAELVKTDPVRRQAAAYAEQMTDIYQGSSDPTSMATFAQSGKTGWENFTKALLVPFNSFAIQQRMRLYSDARDALNGTSGGKGGLAGTIGGLILFHTTKRFVLPVISGGTAAVLYGMLGVDMEEPDEEKQKEMADRNWRQFLADITGNLLVGGTPQIVENRVIEAFNYASYMVGLQLESETVMDENGEIMSFDKYSKERSPFYRYKSYDNAMSLGMFDIGFDQAKETALQTKMLMDREEMEMYTPEEQRLLYFSALSEWLYLMRLNDTDFARIVKKARRDMIKSAEEREKELARIRSGR